MNYRELNKAQLRDLYHVLAAHFDTDKSNQYHEIKQHIKRYYPSEASFAVLNVHCEYNDNTYDNTPRYLAVYNAKQEEILPLKDSAKECRAAWLSFEIPTETHDPIEDIVIRVNSQPLPTIYVKE